MYYNRDLSWLEYNYRILQEAACENVPLYERIKFLSIFSSNFDEFFSIRYPVILAISNFKIKTQRKIENELPEHFIEDVQKEVQRQFNEFGNLLTGQILPTLANNGIILYYNQRPAEQHAAEMRDFFLTRVLSFLQPVFMDGDKRRPLKPEANKLYLIARLRKKNEDMVYHAVINIPSDDLGRFFVLSPIDGRHYVAFIDDVIRDNCAYIFPGFIVEAVYSIKFNRNEDIDYSEDYRLNIVKLIKKQLAKRALGIPSRFLYESSMPKNVQLYVASVFGIEQDEVFLGGRYHNLSDFFSFPVFDKKLTYEELPPLPRLSFSQQSDIFAEIGKTDILLHFPYYSYNPVLSFFNQAAIDPDVTEIYITLYRLAPESLIANALMSAAKNGKSVTVFIELKARFDEANNIEWGRRMKAAGVRLIYSIPGIKVHTKIALAIKNANGVRKGYSLISTGNFNEVTARVYADHTLFSTDETVAAELITLFRFLEERKNPTGTNTLLFNKLLVSQFNMSECFENLINKEIDKARTGAKGIIRIKVNNLEEPRMIDLLYNASKAGVMIQLIVRSICCLVPGVVGLSEHITVKRLVDRYLEHTRIFIFGDDDNPVVIIGSSDWMIRNLYHRIEVCTPIDNEAHKRELLDYFNLQWQSYDKADCSSLENTEAGPSAQSRAQVAIYKYLQSKL